MGHSKHSDLVALVDTIIPYLSTLIGEMIK